MNPLKVKEQRTITQEVIAVKDHQVSDSSHLTASQVCERDGVKLRLNQPLTLGPCKDCAFLVLFLNLQKVLCFLGNMLRRVFQWESC